MEMDTSSPAGAPAPIYPEEDILMPSEQVKIDWLSEVKKPLDSGTGHGNEKKSSSASHFTQVYFYITKHS